MLKKLKKVKKKMNEATVSSLAIRIGTLVFTGTLGILVN